MAHSGCQLFGGWSEEAAGGSGDGLSGSEVSAGSGRGVQGSEYSADVAGLCDGNFVYAKEPVLKNQTNPIPSDPQGIW